MTGRSISKLICLLALLAGLFGCMDEQMTGEETAPQPVEKAQETNARTVDPLELAQDTVPVSTLLGQSVSTGQTRLVPPSKIFPSGDSAGRDSLTAQVFRVQLTMIDTYSDARRALAVAQEIFDQPVTLDYEVPYYKLRVGEFSTRPEAELYQQKARGAGYPNAWVMVATVTAKQIESVYHTDSTAVDTAR